VSSNVSIVLSGFTLIFALAVASTPAQSQETSPNLRPGDLVELRVWPDSSLGGSFRVEDGGIIYVPVIGVVAVAARNVSAIREEILTRLSVELQNPVVQVVPLFRVSLLGAVRSPGLFYVDPTMTLLDLIVRAGGFAPGARGDEVRIMRGDQVYQSDLEAILDGRGGGVDVPLQSGDLVVVPAGGGVNVWSLLRGLVQVTTLTLTIINLSNR
jgi:protein involved in polysaccharide export with SLBB domain